MSPSADEQKSAVSTADAGAAQPLERRQRRGPGWHWLLGYFALVLVVNGLWVTVARDWTQAPDPGDSTNYDSLAWNLAEGRGYGHNWGDAAFREPYVERYTDRSYRRWQDYGFYFFKQSPEDNSYLVDESGAFVLKDDRFEQTAFAPPGLPMLLSLKYRLIGRQYAVWRAVECVMLAAALTMVVGLAGRLGGWQAAYAAGLAGVFDPALRRYVGAYMTEVPATLLVVLIIAGLIGLGSGPVGWGRRSRWLLLIGLAVTFGGLLLFRNLFVLWLPVVSGLAGWCWWRGGQSVQDTGGQRGTGLGAWVRPAVLPGLVFFVLALGTASPWYVRNCVVLDRFMPLGTQGGIGLPGGYSDAAMEARPLGRWVWPGRAFYEPGKAELYGRADVPAVYYQRAEAEYGQRMALEWIGDNLEKVPLLMVGRLWVLWCSPWTILSVVLLALSWYCWRSPGLRPALVVVWACLAVNTAVVMVTYAEGYGRFLMPLQPWLYFAGGLGLSARLAQRRRADAEA